MLKELEDLELDHEMKEEIELIYQKTQRVNLLVSQLLTIARTDQRSFQPEKEAVDMIFLL